MEKVDTPLDIHFDLAVLHKLLTREYMIFTLKPTPSEDEEQKESRTELVFLEKK